MRGPLSTLALLGLCACGGDRASSEGGADAGAPASPSLAGAAGGRSGPAAASADAAPTSALAETALLTEVALEGAWASVAGAPLPREALAETVRARLAETGLFLIPPASAPAGVRVRPARVRGEYILAVAPAAEGKPHRIQAAIRLQLAWSDDDEAFAPQVNVLSETPVPRGRKFDALAPGHIRRTLADAADALGAQERVRRGDAAAVIAALGSPDGALRDAALAATAERRIHEAVPRLIELVRSPDPEARDGAIGALVALRDPRAVRPLTELAKFDDVDTMRRLLDAIGAIGGGDARAFLEFVASGHEHEVIRELAAEALERLRRREGDPPAR